MMLIESNSYIKQNYEHYLRTESSNDAAKFTQNNRNAAFLSSNSADFVVPASEKFSWVGSGPSSHEKFKKRDKSFA